MDNTLSDKAFVSCEKFAIRLQTRKSAVTLCNLTFQSNLIFQRSLENIVINFSFDLIRYLPHSIKINSRADVFFSRQSKTTNFR